MNRYIDILRRHPHPWRFLCARLLVATGLCRLFSIRFRNYQLRFYPSNISTNLWIDINCREGEMDLFEDYICPGDTIIDVGANIGQTAIQSCLKAGSEGVVVAFEAHPRTFCFLQGNLKLNGCTQVEAKNLALGDAEGVLHFSDLSRDDMNEITASGPLAVPVKRLDSVIPAGSMINLLKIDVEGFELPVLRGAGGLLETTRCVFCEMCAAHVQRHHYTTAELLGLLEQAGFKNYVLNGRRQLQRVLPGFQSNELEQIVSLRDEDNFKERTGWLVIDEPVLDRRTLSP